MVNPTSSLNVNWFASPNDQIKDHEASLKKESESNQDNKNPLMPEQLVERTKVSYMIAKRHAAESWKIEKQDLRDRAFIKQWAAQQDDFQGFRQAVTDNIIKNVSVYRIKAETHSELALPSLEALIFRAQSYQEKYNIVIRVVHVSQLGNLLAELQAKITSPTYLGIILDLDLAKFGGNSSLHVIPFLCYLNQQSEKNEYLILDNLALESDIQLIKDLLQAKGISPKAINYSTKIRQADPVSCRTSSITLLRNALLSLRHYQHQNGFQEALKAGKLNPDQTIDELPPDWDYTEQISNKLPSSPKFPIIRHYFSKKAEKRIKQETVAEYRQRYTEEMTSTYYLSENDCDHTETFQAFGVPENKEMTDGKGTTIMVNKRVCELSFIQTRPTNVYLFKKGFSNKSKDMLPPLK